jgi:hypothetical protein
VPHLLSPPLPFVLAAGAAAILAAAAPAGASEGPIGPPPGVPPVGGLTPVGIPQVPAPLTGRHARPRIRGARVVPRHVRSGRRAKLRLRASAPGRLRLAVTRLSRPHRGRIAVRNVVVPRGRLSIRLPKRAHGHALAHGRYRVAVVLIDAQGGRSRTVRRTFTVR